MERVKKLLNKNNLYIVGITTLITIVFLVYIFTLGSRITKARELYINQYDNLRSENVADLSIEELEEVSTELETSLDLWYDSEVDDFKIVIDDYIENLIEEKN